MFLDIDDSHDVVPGRSASPSPGDLLQMEITVPHTDLWNQEFYGAPGSVPSTHPLGDSDVQLSLSGFSTFF